LDWIWTYGYDAIAAVAVVPASDAPDNSEPTDENEIILSDAVLDSEVADDEGTESTD
jgi:hypothetical protein